MGCARRACRISLNPSTRRSPTAWAWASRSAARLSKPMVGGCGRSGASRGVLSFSLRSPLTDPPSVIDVAYWHFSDLAQCPLLRRCWGLSGHHPLELHCSDYEYTPFCNGPGDVKSPRVMSRRRAHASVRGRRRGRHTMLSEGTVSLSRYAWFVG